MLSKQLPNPGDIVLDCFGGGGSTAVAAIKLKRRVVTMEIEPRWAPRLAARVATLSVTGGPEDHAPAEVTQYKPRQMALFSAGI